MADLAQRPTTALRSLGELALAAADRYSGDAMRAPGRPAITYAGFGRAVREIAGGLASLGVNTGDKVAILCDTERSTAPRTGAPWHHRASDGSGPVDRAAVPDWKVTRSKRR